MKKRFLTLILIMCAQLAFTQDDVAMADTMRSNGKIYVVVAVILTILLGLVLYLVRIDKKISKLEKTELHNKK